MEQRFETEQGQKIYAHASPAMKLEQLSDEERFYRASLAVWQNFRFACMDLTGISNLPLSLSGSDVETSARGANSLTPNKIHYVIETNRR